MTTPVDITPETVARQVERLRDHDLSVSFRDTADIFNWATERKALRARVAELEAERDEVTRRRIARLLAELAAITGDKP